MMRTVDKFSPLAITTVFALLFLLFQAAIKPEVSSRLALYSQTASIDDDSLFERANDLFHSPHAPYNEPAAVDQFVDDNDDLTPSAKVTSYQLHTIAIPAAHSRLTTTAAKLQYLPTHRNNGFHTPPVFLLTARIRL